ncbi:MAG: 50S ribosomal protein L21 [Phycisphaerales bacterium]|nr:50S ribosomal protein L21 [Phycisphaerales bacterium]
MYAIIEDSGTQIKVSPGDVVEIDLRDGELGSALTFDRVLAIGGTDSGKPARLGTPYLSGASVSAEIVDHIQGDKVVTIKYSRRKGQRTKKGHRQLYTTVKIGDIKG